MSDILSVPLEDFTSHLLTCSSEQLHDYHNQLFRSIPAGDPNNASLDTLHRLAAIMRQMRVSRSDAPKPEKAPSAVPKKRKLTIEDMEV